MRLNQYIASCGICSRREADKIIDAGRVSVNGEKASFGMQVTDGDVVEVNGKKITPKTETVVLAYYKPVEEIKYPQRVTYAGRLDKDSEGLLILSNDGNLINAMMKSANKHEKEYEVTVDGKISGDFLNRMANGVYLPELDRTTRGCKIKKTGPDSFNIILTQGLNRQIRRMCEALGYKVKKLKRIRVMTVKLSDYNLKPGKYVELKNEEIDRLYKACNIKK